MPTLDELLGGVPSYFFANRPSGPGSYSELESRRKIAQAMLGKRSPFPQNVGQGLTYVGEKIGDVAMLRDINQRDAALAEQQRKTAKEAYDATGPGAQALPPSATPERPQAPPPSPSPDNAISETASLTPEPQPVVPTPAATLTPPTDPRTEIARAITDRAFAGRAGPYALSPARRATGTVPLPPTNLVTLNPQALLRPNLGIPDITSRMMLDARDAVPGSFVPFTEASGGADAPMPTTASAGGGGPPTSVPMPPPRPVYDRNRQIGELQADPALEQRLLTIAKGEVGDDPRGQQLIAETIMNRAAARGQPLEQVMRQYTGPQSSGYYPASTFGRGQASPNILTPVLRGSDEGGQALGFAPTGNASGSVAGRGIASGRYNAAGRLPGSAETFVQQERPQQLARLAETRLGGDGGGGGGGGGPSGNPPIPTNIPPAPPASVAQLRPGGGSALPGPFDPRQPEPTPQSAGGGVVPARPYADVVGQPPRYPLPGDDERRAVQMMNSTDDPYQRASWKTAVDYFAGQRQKDYETQVEKWKGLIAIGQKGQEQEYAARIEQGSPMYQQNLAAAQFKLSQEKKAAGEGLPVKDVVELLKPEYENKITGAMNAAEAIKEARRYVPDMFSGRLAEFNLQAAKTALALSPAGTFPELEKRVQATEKYRAIANQLAGALRPIIAGNNQQSNAELDRILESAAVGAPTEANTRLEILNNIGRSNFLNIHRFQERAAGLAGGDENRQRDILRALPTRMETQIPESTIAKLQRNYRESPTQQTLDEFNQTFFTPGLAQRLLVTHGMGQ